MLEGGLPAWKAAGGPVDTSAAPDSAVQRSKQAASTSAAVSTRYKAVLKKDKVGSGDVMAAWGSSLSFWQLFVCGRVGSRG